MTISRKPTPPVPWAPAHRRSWRTLWRRCSCGLTEPCVDRVTTPADPVPIVDTATPRPQRNTAEFHPRSTCPPHNFVTTSPRRGGAVTTLPPARGHAVPPMTDRALGRLDMSTGTIATHTAFHLLAHSPGTEDPPTRAQEAAPSPQPCPPATALDGIDETPTNLLGHVTGTPTSAACAIDLMNIAADRAAKALDAGSGESAFGLVARAAETALLSNERALSIPVLAPPTDWSGEPTAEVPVVASERWRGTDPAHGVSMATSPAAEAYGVDEREPDERVMARFLAVMREFTVDETPTHHPRPQQQPNHRPRAKALAQKRSDRPEDWGPAHTGHTESTAPKRTGWFPNPAPPHSGEIRTPSPSGRASVLLPGLIGRAGHLTPAQAERAGYGERHQTSHLSPAKAERAGYGEHHHAINSAPHRSDVTGYGEFRHASSWSHDPLEPEAGRSSFPFRHDDPESGFAW